MKMVEAYRAAGEAEAQIIKGLLESNGVPCFLKSNAAPSVHAFIFDGMGTVKIMVEESFRDKTKRLIMEKESV